MKIVQNKDFKKEFPSEMTQIMNDICVFMNYHIVIQFSNNEENKAVKVAKKISKTESFDQIGIDSAGLKYFGVYD